MSYWASLEIEMSLLGKRLSAGQFIKESVGVVKQVSKLSRNEYSLPMLTIKTNKKAPGSSTSVSSNTAGWEVPLPHRRLRQVSFRDRNC